MNYLISPNFYSAINLLLQNAQPHNMKYWNDLILNLFAYIIANQEVMELFVKPNYSPLLEQYAKLVVSNIDDQPEQYLQLFSYCNSIQLFNQFYSTNQALLKLIIDFISECITTYTTDSTKTDILFTISNSFEVMSQEIANKFSQMFDDLIVKRFVSISNPETSLSNSIYILANLQAKNVVLTIFNYISKKLPQFIVSEDDQISYLSFRLSTLLLEYTNPRLHEKYSGRVSSDFTNLLRANWFVNTDTTEILEVVRMNVAKSELEEGIVNWDIEELLLSVKKILIDLLDKEEKVFCACIEFVTELAANKDNCVSFYTLSSECENGMYNSIKELCLTVARRIGNRPSTVDQLKQAYSKLSENNYEDDSEGLLFRKIVLIIEFLKELNAISNVKNSFRMSYLE
ncbi:hypothetical protein TVAG_325060 [Trichomonas vaginalis G3]|uniref:Uncharacterized protein n=1 Tax=Trichomonas vaginalis (strain ATCC PRA-98 / G3) TaxID=412133 RepID=A2F141_TRIV3|nr:hypothetical protein TVAGG3_0814830 [Trichomonas vaginalis G3]EAY01392.1 hypothetical protein TVAG_325060 [Trichomonas vaginalis G3]KAI5497458.1 hypothetical protein TVAGG3_0814830 [Trichomonas vaginalis G3]|eukprot:XP_001330240.1 hypothetical protein [Trichomonas vaginalis G3]